MSEWISVKDRLPNKNESIICFCTDGDQRIANFCEDTKEYYSGGWQLRFILKNDWTDKACKMVSHWMPLPEPPKDKE